MSEERMVNIAVLSPSHIAITVRGKLESNSAWEIHHLVGTLLLPQTRHICIDFYHCNEFTESGLNLLFDFLAEMGDWGLSVELSGIAMDQFHFFRKWCEGANWKIHVQNGEYYSLILRGHEGDNYASVEDVYREESHGG